MVKTTKYKEMIKTYHLNDEEYPEKLRLIKKPPEKIDVIGTLPDPDKPTVAIVGARNCSDYGTTIAKSVARSLSMNGVQVISGLALGIDCSAHIGAIEAKAKTFAVLGSGVNVCYPTYNFNIYEKIIEFGGGIISELNVDTEPLPYNFPLRNRIISGLSDVVLIVEAKNSSGALITCEYGLEQGKDIFAVPGRVGDLLSMGTNNLIKQGAYIMTCIEDLYERLGVVCDSRLTVDEKNIEKLDYFEKLVYSNLSFESKHIDEIIINTKLPLEKCINTLMSLQINGFVECPRMNYYRVAG